MPRGHEISAGKPADSDVASSSVIEEAQILVSGNRGCVQKAPQWQTEIARNQTASPSHCSACLISLLQFCAGHSLYYGEEAPCRYDLHELEAGLHVQDKILLVHSHILRS